MPDLLARLQAALADRYTIERELGCGGMATVYLAEDLKHHRQVAIKVLKPELAAALGPERFLREIELAARLTHPHILPLHDSGQAGGFLYYVMPYIEGESLRERLEREGPLPLDDALRITREVASALSDAHSHNVVHRDIKPENILLSGGEAVVADFGIARAITRAAGSGLTETGIPVGTPAYMSPEQASGGGLVDGRSDIYSLGCVLYEMLAGEPPYTGASAQMVIAKRFTDPVPSVRRLRDTIPPAIDGAVSKALGKAPADRFVTAAQFAEALTSSSAPAVRPRRLSTRRILVTGAVTAAVGALVVAAMRWRAGVGSALDPNLVAIAPFDVLAPTLELWHEGLVDVLSRNLDGAGPLRTVSPTVVVRRWSGRADPTSAKELGRKTGAQVVVFGGIVAAGQDSVRLTATVFDVGSGTGLADLELHGTAARMDRLSDSLTVGVLRELGRTRPIGAVRLASLGSTSLPAIKAFLRGEQFYRRAVWDSALVYARRAVAIDSNFTLALRRIPLVLWWSISDTSWTTYELRAGALNHGLAPRESLLVAADSLWGALDQGEASEWPLMRHLVRTLEEALRRYPDDPEVWYLWAEMAYQHYSPLQIPVQKNLEAYQRAIELDSAFGPAYEHAVDLAIRMDRLEWARRYAAAERALAPAPYVATSLSLIDKLLSPRGAQSPEVARMLDTLSGDALWETAFTIRRWPDSAETVLRLVRLLAVPRHGYQMTDSSTVGWALPVVLMARGHLSEAYRSLWGTRWASENPALLPELALVGATPADSVAIVFGRWRGANDPGMGAALGWWAAMADTVSIRDVARRADSLGRVARKVRDRDFWRYVAAASRVYIAVARQDTSAAVEGFAMLPDSLCPDCVLDQLRKAQLLGLRGRNREAAELLDREPHNPNPVPLTTVFWWLERGRVKERLGKNEEAIPAYRLVADWWRNADPELQPYVAEARAALKRLGGKPQ